ncbi:MAG: hypothetical protein FJ271_00780 [Planctomycetes bacterium]|nr:hypothetical protein [Planctomycetota bacterium]
MRQTLSRLVQLTPDPYHLVYVTENLRVPPFAKLQIGTPEELTARSTAMMRLLAMSWQLQFQTLQKTQIELFDVFSQVQRSSTRERAQEQHDELRKIAVGDPDVLRAKLKDKNPLLQLAAIEVIHNRRVPLEKELLSCLTAPHAMVRESARHALVRLARGVDFGPKAGCTAAQCRQAMRRWEAWIARQQESADETPSGPAGDAIDPAVARAATELLQAAGVKETEVLQRLREADEPHGSLVLLLAIPDLKGTRQLKARQALTDRLNKLDADELSKRLTDEDAEMRRAALAAAALKRDRSFIPEALRLLEDGDIGVSQAARAALKAVAGQDFGPPATATPSERVIALGRWYQWWSRNSPR